MKTWSQVKAEYARYLSEKKLKQPGRRISALNKIEQCLQSSYPSFLKGHSSFTYFDKGELKERFKSWKGTNLNGAESQVINDFYKLALLPIAN